MNQVVLEQSREDRAMAYTIQYTLVISKDSKVKIKQLTYTRMDLESRKQSEVRKIKK